MDFKKLAHFKFTLDGSGLEDSKLSLALTVIASFISVYLTYLIVNTIQNYDVYQTTHQQLKKIEDDKKMLESNFKLLVRGNAEYFVNLKSSPKSRSELASALSNAISENNLKLIKLNSNDGNLVNKDALVEVEAAGTYTNIDRFTRAVNKFIGASELENLKLTKVKEDGLLHVALSLKFSPPPTIDLPVIKPEARKISELKGEGYGDWKIIKTAFVPVEAKSPPIETNDNTVKKDPFQSPEPNKTETNAVTKPDLRAADQRLSGYYLSGIFYSKHQRYCVISLPTGESKVFKEGEKVSPVLRIRKIIPGYVVTNSKKSSRTHVGEEISP
jgi:hypothetical protein